MRYTQNVTTVDPENLAPTDYVSSLTLRTWAGQAVTGSLRLVQDAPEYWNATIEVSCPDERVSLSLDGLTFAPTVQYPTEPTVGPLLSIRMTAPVYQTGETVETHLSVGTSETFPLVLAFNDIDSEDPYASFDDEKTRVVKEAFAVDSEVVTLIRYDPLSYEPCQSNPYSLVERDNRNLAELANPENDNYWHKTVYRAKCFVGNQTILDSMVYSFSLPAVSFTDNERILIAPEFDGFQPSISHLIAVPALTPDATGFRRTVWCLVRNDTEYHLQHIQRQRYYHGSFLFYYSDLVAIQYPGAASEQTYLPWGILYDVDSKPIAMLRSFATGSVSSEEPYGGFAP